MLPSEDSVIALAGPAQLRNLNTLFRQHKIEVDADRVEELTAALRGLSEIGVVDVSDAGAGVGDPTDPVGLHVVGHDQPGIVREVTRALADRGLSIQEFHPSTSDAPMSGDRLFEAVAVIGLPESIDLSDLRTALGEVSAELSLDIQLDDGDESPAWGEVPDRA